ncbi:MAG: putative metal-binding protein [Acidobacteria bacterium OLB17]|nr:MAG: putative metal-binding protein [Acidobacteria bacterium OLB17]MCZ2389630.1 DUF177 domain-containing protein [Acidobacteriota bacterium]
MKIDLAAATVTPKEIKVSLPPEAIDVSPDAEIVANVDFNGTVWRDPRGAHISGHLSTAVKAECVRCLEPAEKRIEVEFDDLFVEELEAGSGEIEVAAGSLDESVAGDAVELAEVLREQILLELPDQPLCREDCKGLCPKCGQNRNLIDCNCSAEIDPRWAALRDLN